VTGDEEGCDSVCIRLSDVSEGEGGASETWWRSTVVGGTGVEMGQHLHGLCDSSSTDFQGT